mmetsp:Transcript_21718/g.28103  ORF Transcript_21718/g.28103 Transcript_21718/m.28103 type:complete len:630 (+) Transcript_21718:74-1963(+)
MNTIVNLDKVRNMAEDALGQARGLRDETERKVFEALNNKNWGASSTTLLEIARETYDYEKFHKIFKLIWEAADSPARNWRKIFKSLMLCEYLVKNGAERCVDEIRDHTFKIRQLQDFRYTEESLDRGQGTREKAKQLLELLSDNTTIREARENAKRLRDKLVGSSSRFSGGGGYGNDSFSSGPVGYGGSGQGYGGSYSDNGRGGGETTGRYSDGGGVSSFSAGTSDAPGRYSRDEGTMATSSYGNQQDDFTSSTTATGGTSSLTPAINLKLKPKTKPVPRLKMKGDTPSSSNSVAEENFFDTGPTTITSSEQPIEEPATDLFDAFTTSPPPTTQPQQQQQVDFADFSSAAPPPPPPQQDNFAAFPPTAPQPDVFSQPLQPSIMSGMQQQAMMPPSQQPMQQPSNMIMPGFGSTPQQSVMQPQQPAFGQQYNVGGGMMMGSGGNTRPPAMGGTAFSSGPQARTPAMSGDDFGDFEASPAAVQPPVQKSPKDTLVDASSNLVSLDALSKNSSAMKASSPAAAKASYAQHAAFTGLDGFNTTPQPTMMNSIQPNFQQQPYGGGASGYGMAPPPRPPQMQQMSGYGAPQQAAFQQPPTTGVMGMPQHPNGGMQQPYYPPQQGPPMGANPYGGW